MNQRIIVSGIVQRGDEVLIGRKAKGQPPYPDVWHTLGGGIDNLKLGEQLLKMNDYDNKYFHAELRRELAEEANISIQNIINICPKVRVSPRESMTKNKDGIETHYIFLEYICEYEESDEQPGDDIVEIRWVNKKSLGDISLTPPSIEMYTELGWIE